jgi:hypothetical protein
MLKTITREGYEKGDRWAKQSRHTLQMVRLRKSEVKSLQWQRLQDLQDATA